MADTHFDSVDVATLKKGGTEITPTAAELNTATGVTAGVVTASKHVVPDANKDVASFRDVTFRKVKVGDSANDHVITIEGAADEAANRTLSIPAMGGNKTVALRDVDNDFAGRQTTTDGVAAGIAKVMGGRANAWTADGSALTNSLAETVLASLSIPASTLKAGSRLRVRFMVSITADNGATTLTIRLRIGPTTLTGTVLLASTATDTSANHVCLGEFTLISLAAPGAGAACRGWGHFQEPGAAGGAFKSAVLGTGGAGANLATNGALLLEVTGQWSAADANSCAATYFDVEID